MNEELIITDKFCPYIKPAEGISYCLGGNCALFDNDNQQCAVMTVAQAATISTHVLVNNNNSVEAVEE